MIIFKKFQLSPLLNLKIKYYFILNEIEKDLLFNQKILEYLRWISILLTILNPKYLYLAPWLLFDYMYILFHPYVPIFKYQTSCYFQNPEIVLTKDKNKVDHVIFTIDGFKYKIRHKSIMNISQLHPVIEKYHKEKLNYLQQCYFNRHIIILNN